MFFRLKQSAANRYRFLMRFTRLIGDCFAKGARKDMNQAIARKNETVQPFSSDYSTGILSEILAVQVIFSRYPTPGSVTRYAGRAGSASILRRRLLMLTCKIWVSLS